MKSISGKKCVVDAVVFLLVWPSTFLERHTTYTHTHTWIYTLTLYSTPTSPHSFLSKQLAKHYFVSQSPILNKPCCVCVCTVFVWVIANWSNTHTHTHIHTHLWNTIANKTHTPHSIMCVCVCVCVLDTDSWWIPQVFKCFSKHVVTIYNQTHSK